MSPQRISYLVTFVPDMATSKPSPGEIKSLIYRRNALKKPGGLGAEPPESNAEEEISTLPLDLPLDGRSPRSTGARGVGVFRVYPRARNQSFFPVSDV